MTASFMSLVGVASRSPNFDRERVNVSDIKKLIKWYAILEDLDVIKKSEVTDESKPVLKKEQSHTPKVPAKDMTVHQQNLAKPRMTKNKVYFNLLYYS